MNDMINEFISFIDEREEFLDIQYKYLIGELKELSKSKYTEAEVSDRINKNVATQGCLDVIRYHFERIFKLNS